MRPRPATLLSEALSSGLGASPSAIHCHDRPSKRGWPWRKHHGQKNRFLYLDSLPLLSQHCLLPLSLALTQRWLSALTHSATQQTRLLDSSSLSRMAVFSYSNSVLLIILIMSYTIFVLYSGAPSGTTFR
jgi:hypothetical protein